MTGFKHKHLNVRAVVCGNIVHPTENTRNLSLFAVLAAQRKVLVVFYRVGGGGDCTCSGSVVAVEDFVFARSVALVEG